MYNQSVLSSIYTVYIYIHSSGTGLNTIDPLSFFSLLFVVVLELRACAVENITKSSHGIQNLLVVQLKINKQKTFIFEREENQVHKLFHEKISPWEVVLS